MVVNLFILFTVLASEIVLPIRVENRKAIEQLRLTEIGKFAIIRKGPYRTCTFSYWD